ncbi:hypothetical protein GCM10010218_36690 [Streptomyces mashuensis]|uniref:Uncharacterized protein n=1 Tax=Streptomyces mashuensis TaxID=33904 RepID=A0A919B4P4_9ACTN|nr:hypothetical protein [Streptomyces mashuensis]GHF51712.1 hypothetical protein GCM10010218_36690 [Streptomyces mashuensis]
MNHPVDPVGAAATALDNRSWIPADHELTLAREFFVRRDALDQRLLPGMPPCPSPQGWTTQHVLWLGDVAALATDLLNAWRPWLPEGHGHMASLLTTYATMAASAAPLATRLVRDWADAWQGQGTVSPQDTSRWEDWHLPKEQREQLDALTDRLVMVGAVMVMAVNRGETSGPRR